jgi:hypothetical protein
MKLDQLQQHSNESPGEFLLRINNQAALCDLTKLAQDMVGEMTKLIFMVGISSPHSDKT